MRFVHFIMVSLVVNSNRKVTREMEYKERASFVEIYWALVKGSFDGLRKTQWDREFSNSLRFTQVWTSLDGPFHDFNYIMF